MAIIKGVIEDATPYMPFDNAGEYDIYIIAPTSWKEIIKDIYTNRYTTTYDSDIHDSGIHLYGYPVHYSDDLEDEILLIVPEWIVKINDVEYLVYNTNAIWHGMHIRKQLREWSDKQLRQWLLSRDPEWQKQDITYEMERRGMI